MDFDWSVVIESLPALLDGAKLTVFIALAGLLGISTRRLGQLHSEGIAVKVDRGLYDAAATVQAMLAHASGKAAGNVVELDLDRERARLAKEQADGQAINLAPIRTYLSVSAHARVWRTIQDSNLKPIA